MSYKRTLVTCELPYANSIELAAKYGYEVLCTNPQHPQQCSISLERD